MRTFFIYTTLIIMLAACSPNKPNEPKMDSTDNHPSSTMNEPDEVKQYFQTEKKINDWHIFQDDKHVLVAVKLKHFQRFNRKKLEKEWTKDIQAFFPEKEVVVSSDFKVMYELNKLQHNDSKQLSEKAVEKKVTKLIKLLQEQT